MSTFDLIIDTLIEVSIGVGGFIFLALICFSFISNMLKSNIKNNFIKSKFIHPIIGAFLGVSPGCGGAISVAVLFENKVVNYGTLLAAFLATIGEGTFFLLGVNYKLWINLSILLFVVSVFFGYLFEIMNFNFKPNPKFYRYKYMRKNDNYHKEYTDSHNLMVSTYLILGFLIVPFSLFNLIGLENEGIISKISISLGLTFGILSIIYHIFNRYIYKTHDCAIKSNLKNSLIHSTQDISMIITYIFIGLIINSIIIENIIGLERFEMFVKGAGPFLIIVTTIIALLPGCSTYILIATLYLGNVLPLSSFIAASLATKGDAIFPILVSDKKIAINITIHTAIISILFGTIFFILGY